MGTSEELSPTKPKFKSNEELPLNSNSNSNSKSNQNNPNPLRIKMEQSPQIQLNNNINVKNEDMDTFDNDTYSDSDEDEEEDDEANTSTNEANLNKLEKDILESTEQEEILQKNTDNLQLENFSFYNKVINENNELLQQPSNRFKSAYNDTTTEIYDDVTNNSLITEDVSNFDDTSNQQISFLPVNFNAHADLSNVQEDDELEEEEESSNSKINNKGYKPIIKSESIKREDGSRFLDDIEPSEYPLGESTFDHLRSQSKKNLPFLKLEESTMDNSSGFATDILTKILQQNQEMHKNDYNDFMDENFRPPHLFASRNNHDSFASDDDIHKLWAAANNKVEASTLNPQYGKNTTIRSSSMRSFPSMNQDDVKKIMQAKKQITGHPYGKPLNSTNANNSNESLSFVNFPENNSRRPSTQIDSNNLNAAGTGNHFINDTINRGSGSDDEDSLEDDVNAHIANKAKFHDENFLDCDNTGREIQHIADILSEKPRPLLPEQTFENSDMEDDLKNEYEKINRKHNRGYILRRNSKLIVAKSKDNRKNNIDRLSFIEDENSNRSGMYASDNLESNNKEKHPHAYSNMLKEQQAKAKFEFDLQEKESNRNSSQSQKSSLISHQSRISSATSTASNNRISVGSNDINMKKRKSRALKEKAEKPITIDQENFNEQLKPDENDPELLDKKARKAKQLEILEQRSTFLDVNLPNNDKGRLYVKIVGLKSLELPGLERHEAKFHLILDNGIHCISTPNLELNDFSAINQEFELTVGDNLEFILTLKAEYNYKSQNKVVEITEKVPIKKKRFGGLFGSKIIYKSQKKFITKVDNDDPWDNIMARDGSFARAYVDFQQYEPLINGKACNFDVTCFNEWEVTKDSKTDAFVKKQPYRIGKLELQMLFIPRTKKNEIFPPSIEFAYDSINEYMKQLSVYNDGYLLQDGGDCNYLKRRFFKLIGTDFVAHNEISKKTRAKINLSKATALITEKGNKSYALAGSAFANNNHSKDGHPAARRNLSEEILMNQGFKIKFSNNEVIEFVAENASEKQKWIAALDKVISRNQFRQPWIKYLYQQSMGS
ncbi:Bud4p [Ascoidea rubescens DSM 1968]|uniref:DUF1709-domain-containing protein n=1 Tax=Ascoidea rubescens DSM 1968 TaxID=1344418 RepID=A0A1D2V9G0_9ASCO|nr:DUF1709-domain-containing protein [Ascoidea rubescens DSM 1968]ODV58302.1 DUF1709-domain-containing protein [Ascoidea rubescens DSM 1968]